MKKETKYLIALAALIGVVLFFVFKQKQELDKKSDTDKKEPKENKGNDAKGNDTNTGDDGTKSAVYTGATPLDPDVRDKIISCFVKKGGHHDEAEIITAGLSEMLKKHKANANTTNEILHASEKLAKVLCAPCNTNEVAEHYNYIATAGKPVEPIGWYEKEPTIERPAVVGGDKVQAPISIGEVKALQYEKLESNGKEVRML